MAAYVWTELPVIYLNNLWWVKLKQHILKVSQIAKPGEIISSVSEKKVEKSSYFGELYPFLETVLTGLQCSQFVF